MWAELRDRVVALMAEIRVGDPCDFRIFMGAVIDSRAFERISEYLREARRNARIIVGRGAGDRQGYFIEPTFVESPTADSRLLREEIFGPVLTVFVYDDSKWPDILTLVDGATPYALTGAVFARDRRAILEAVGVLRYAAGNFYINDKPTGAVVGQQPFGGSRASGTNDKAGSKLNLLRWVTPRSIKETFVPARDIVHPSMAAE